MKLSLQETFAILAVFMLLNAFYFPSLAYSGTSLLRTLLGPSIFGQFLLQYRGFPL